MNYRKIEVIRPAENYIALNSENNTMLKTVMRFICAEMQS
jgi:hypothetical protein